ncbi:ankyrin repeat domain-containing protein [Turneriella parva]|uniref:Ankyrin n=1 Tax=Turneriella parva (strain ATCC BAA-1111 / DSM 21527 / NCTC 11395 / H) TaxID=869212 RepID=I4B4T7_TURPD|nr:ankyrin repeat domain-containing protein [Turneriella parva]AFM12294.1 Ankyrin [Turneriella parva DSM 21527]
MIKFFAGFGLLIAFAVVVTGIATLLNGLFSLGIAIEGTMAPADARAGFILICIGLSLALLCVPAFEGPLQRRLSTQKLLLVPYLAMILALAVLPIFFAYRADAPLMAAQQALSRGDAAFFKNGAAWQGLTVTERERLFSQSLRLKNVTIAKLLAADLQNLTGEPDSPNAFLAAYTANAEIFELLIERGADLSYREPLTGTGLMHQIVSGAGKPEDQLRCLEILSKRQMLDVNAVADFGTTPLMIAAERGNAMIVKFLLTHGADVNLKDKVASTALHKTCDKTIVYPDTAETARLVVAKLLIRAGADSREKNQLGQDCASLAASSGFMKLAAELGR